jgi:hypothetical protein
MSQILLGALALAVAIWLLRSYSRASPSLMASGLRKAGGLVAMAAGALLLARGRFDIAVPLLIFGAGLAGWLPGTAGRLFGTTRTPGQRSRVRSRMLDMELAHDSGALTGRVLAGRFVGRSLDDLQAADLMALHAEIRADAESLSLLEAYLDRRTPGWRENVEHDATARTGGRRGRHTMTKEEAYEVLGVKPGAEAEEIRRAHRTLMKKLHPDQGGSTYLAARVNEARDLLLGSHT